MTVDIRRATDADAAAITEIYNDSVAVATASWDEAPERVDDRRAWLADRDAAGDVVLVAVDGDQVLGWAGYGPFRFKSGYRHTREHTIYLAEEARGRGIGRRLLAALIDQARARGVHVLIGSLSHENDVSWRLHESLGFRQVGRLPQVGAKFGRWLDLVFVALVLDELDVPTNR